MLEALWSVEFSSNVPGAGNYGAGIVVLETGRIFGGDGQYFYLGDYKYDIRTETATANLKVTHYAGPAHSVFGPAKQFNLVLTGKPQREKFAFDGHVVERPQLTLKVRVTRRAELP